MYIYCIPTYYKKMIFIYFALNMTLVICSKSSIFFPEIKFNIEMRVIIYLLKLLILLTITMHKLFLLKFYRK